MENQFVSFDVAKKLKDIGFNEPCFAFSLSSGDITMFQDTPFEMRTNKEFIDKYFNPDTCTTRPTHQQVSDFFRENYGLHFQINRHWTDNPNSWRITIYDYSNDDLAYNQNVSEEPYYKTYYDALSIAIEIALTIIIYRKENE